MFGLIENIEEYLPIARYVHICDRCCPLKLFTTHSQCVSYFALEKNKRDILFNFLLLFRIFAYFDLIVSFVATPTPHSNYSQILSP